MTRAPTEFELQRAFCIFLDGSRTQPAALRENVVYFHVPNGGARSAIEGARFKTIGVKAGVPDLVFLAHQRFYLMEWKMPGGVLSPAQKTMHGRLIAAGATSLITVDNLKDAREWAFAQMLTIRF